MRARPTPVSVPPVADADHKRVDLALRVIVDFFAVVFSCTSGFAGLSNCPGMTGVGQRLRQLFRSRDCSRHTARARRQFQFGAEVSKNLPALDRHRLRHDENEPVAARCRDESQTDARVARGRLDENGLARLDAASASSASIIATPMRSLTDDSGLKNSSFNKMSALTCAAAAIFESRTSGVWPMVSVMLS